MSDPYIGEIRPFAFNFAPQGWFACDGSQKIIQNFPALFAILGSRFGGDGKTTFAVPDLRGRAVVSANSNGQLPPVPVSSSLPPDALVFGKAWGASDITLSYNQMPIHSHTAQGYGPPVGVTQVGTADSTCFLGLLRMGTNTYDVWSSVTDPTGVTDHVINSVGGGQSHDNNQPYLPLNFCICWDGVFPPHPD